MIVSELIEELKQFKESSDVFCLVDGIKMELSLYANKDNEAIIAPTDFDSEIEDVYYETYSSEDEILNEYNDEDYDESD